MKKSLLIIPLLLVGCAKVSDYQASCEQRYQKLSDMANCLDASVKNDSRMASAPTPKLYVLAAKMLGQGVDERSKVFHDRLPLLILQVCGILLGFCCILCAFIRATTFPAFFRAPRFLAAQFSAQLKCI